MKRHLDNLEAGLSQSCCLPLHRGSLLSLRTNSLKLYDQNKASSPAAEKETTKSRYPLKLCEPRS